MRRPISFSSKIIFTILFLIHLSSPASMLADEKLAKKDGWTPPKKSDWVSIGSNIKKSFQAIKKIPALKLAPMMNKGKYKHVRSGIILAPLVSVDRTTGTLYAFPQSGALFVSKDQGQTFSWLNREVTSWGFNESPTSLHVSPDGKKIRVFSSNLSGFSLDAGKTWSYMNFKIPFGFEDGHINWHDNSKTIIVRSHTWSKPRLWLSQDGGKTFNHFSKELENKVSSQVMAMFDNDVIIFQSSQKKGRILHRTEDYCKTFTNIAPPKYKKGKKEVKGIFKGISRRFKGKVYWLSNLGVYTSPDKGKTWDLVGNHFPDEYVRARDFIRSGPAFGKDENHMVVMCQDQFLETVDGGKSWYTLAYAPARFSYHRWSYSFAYDPIEDILYCNKRGHSGGPYLFARLALKRWGSIEKIAPSNPSEIKTSFSKAGSRIKLSWKASEDASKIRCYRIYIDDQLKYHADRCEIIISDLPWGKSAMVSIQAVDFWGNLSEKITQKVISSKRPKGVVILKSLKPIEAKANNGELQLLEHETVGKTMRPLTLRNSLLEPSAIKNLASTMATNAIGINVNKSLTSATLAYSLGKKYKRLFVDIGLKNGVWGNMSLTIKADDKIIGTAKGGSGYSGVPSISFDLDISGAEKLTFTFQSKKRRHFRGAIIVLNNALLMKKD